MKTDPTGMWELPYDIGITQSYGSSSYYYYEWGATGGQTLISGSQPQKSSAPRALSVRIDDGSRSGGGLPFASTPQDASTEMFSLFGDEDPTPRGTAILKEAKAALADPVLGDWLRQLKRDYPAFKVTFIEGDSAIGGESFAAEDRPSIDSANPEKLQAGNTQPGLVYIGRGTRSPDGYHLTLRDKVWHEIGHHYSFVKNGVPAGKTQAEYDAEVLVNFRTAIEFENRARASEPNNRAPLWERLRYGGSQSRRIHWVHDSKGDWTFDRPVRVFEQYDALKGGWRTP